MQYPYAPNSNNLHNSRNKLLSISLLSLLSKKKLSNILKLHVKYKCYMHVVVKSVCISVISPARLVLLSICISFSLLYAYVHFVLIHVSSMYLLFTTNPLHKAMFLSPLIRDTSQLMWFRNKD